MGTIILSSLFTVFFVGFLVLLYMLLSLLSSKKRLSEKFEEQKISQAIVAQELAQYKAKCEKLEANHDELLVLKTESETRLVNLESELKELNLKYKEAVKEKSEALEVKNEYQRKQELALQRVRTVEMEMKNWEKMKEEQNNNLKASTLEAVTKLSSKLLDDHKRESQLAKKESEKLVKQTTEGLIQSVSVLQEGVKRSEVVHRALLSPTGAGSLGEITLENIFKNSGLIAGQDYQMQYSVSSESGRGLRPDAVVFMPNNNVMVIDSKASKFFLELGEDEVDKEKKKDIYANLKRSMNENLKSLASREYSKAIEEQAGKSLARVYMFLPTETALDKLRKADPKFIEKAWGQGICPVAPTGLLNELLRASMIISNAKQEENAKVIIAQVKDILGNVATLNEHASKLGKGLKSAIDNYDKFSASFNTKFMSKANKITKLGVDVPKLKTVQPLPQFKASSFDIRAIDANYSDEDSETNVVENKLEFVSS